MSWLMRERQLSSLCDTGQVRARSGRSLRPKRGLNISDPASISFGQMSPQSLLQGDAAITPQYRQHTWTIKRILQSPGRLGASEAARFLTISANCHIAPNTTLVFSVVYEEPRATRITGCTLAKDFYAIKTSDIPSTSAASIFTNQLV